MAYMNKEKKAKIATELKKVVPAGWKYSLAIVNSAIYMTVYSAPVNIIEEAKRVWSSKPRAAHEKWFDRDHLEVNPYWVKENYDESVEILQKIINALNTGNHDRSDIMIDHFDVGHYIGLFFGTWNKPYIIKQ